MGEEHLFWRADRTPPDPVVFGRSPGIISSQSKALYLVTGSRGQVLALRSWSRREYYGVFDRIQRRVPPWPRRPWRAEPVCAPDITC